MKVIILILLQGLLIATSLKLMRKKNISIILSVSLLVFSLLWYVIPVFIKVFLDQFASYTILVDFDVYVQYATLETITLLMVMAFLFVPTPYFNWVKESSLNSVEIRPQVALVVPIIGLAFGWFMTIITRAVGETYYDRNAFAVIGQGSMEYENLGSLSFIQGMLVSFAYVCLIVKWPRTRATILLYILTIIWLTSVNLPYVQLGGRIVLLLPLILMIFRGKMQQWSLKKMITNIGTLLIITLIIGGLIGLAVTETRTQRDLELGALASKSAEVFKSSSSDTALQQMVGEMLTKFDSISWGAALVEYAGFDVAGWQPYLGSLASLMPRQIIPDKPVPGSVNGEYQGHPTRLIAERMGYDPLSGNVQVSPAAISMWQFGYWGLGAFILCNVLCLYFINSLLLSPSLLSKTLAIFLISIPGLYTFIASPDVLLLNLQRALLIYLVLLTVSRIFNMGDLRSHRYNNDRGPIAIPNKV